MDRKQWLTMVYREANLFIETHTGAEGKLTPEAVDDLEPELNAQLQEPLRHADHLEDIVKHSLLKNPPPDLWYAEGEWPRVLVAVASACLLHDVKGVALKILSGDLPKTPSSGIVELLE